MQSNRREPPVPLRGERQQWVWCSHVSSATSNSWFTTPNAPFIRYGTIVHCPAIGIPVKVAAPQSEENPRRSSSAARGMPALACKPQEVEAIPVELMVCVPPNHAE